MTLTPREVEVARLLVRGHSYGGIARMLGIAESTVGVHVTNAAGKLPGEGSPKVKLLLFVVDLMREQDERDRAG